MMPSAAVIMIHRQKLWEEVRDNPEYGTQRVAKIMAQIERINATLKSRCMDPKTVKDLLKEIKPGRTHKSVAKKHKISRRKVKYILKTNRKK